MFTKIAPRFTSHNTPKVLDVALMDGRYVYAFTAENSIRVIGRIQTAHSAHEIVTLARAHVGNIRADAATWHLLQSEQDIAPRMVEP